MAGTDLTVMEPTKSAFANSARTKLNPKIYNSDYVRTPS